MENQTNLVLNDLAVDSLRVSAKWTMFLAVVGFIFIGLMLVGGLVAMAALSSVPDEPAFGGFNPVSSIQSYLGIIYLVMAVIYFFPVLYLYKFAKSTKEALLYNNSELLAEGLQNLKSHYKYVGIVTIVMLCLYALTFVGIFIFAASMAGGAM